MNWIDIASIVFVCVTANHLGLISAIESAIHLKLWIVDCPKCIAFWATLAYQCCGGTTTHSVSVVFAISFLCSYLAIWLELFEGFIDTLYMKLYETIYPNTDNDTPASDADNGYSADTVS